MTSLATDRRGSTYVEFLIIIVPFALFVLCVAQTALIEFADLVVERSADAAVRSAVVVLDDDPALYAGEARNAVAPGGAREGVIRRGAANALAALPDGEDAQSSTRLRVEFPTAQGSDQLRSSFAPDELVTLRVAYLFRCAVPLARRIMCRDASGAAQEIDSVDSFALIRAEASLPNQGARYEYAGASRGAR